MAKTLTLASPLPPNLSPRLLRLPSLPLPHPRRHFLLRPAAAAAVTAAAQSPAISADEYGGWDEILSTPQYSYPGGFTRLSGYFAAFNADDRRQAFMFLLGFVASMAIARVRLSSMFIVPASAVVFIVGFCVGAGGLFREFVARNGGGDFSSGDNRKILALFDEKIRILGGFLAELDSKIFNLKGELEVAAKADRVEVSEIRRCINVLESVKVDVIMPAKNLLEVNNVVSDWESALSDKIISGSGVLDKKLVDDFSEKNSITNHRMRKQRRDLLVVGMDFARVFVGGLFFENMPAQKKATDSADNAAFEKVVGRESGNNQVSASVFQSESFMHDQQDKDYEGLAMDQNSEAGESKSVGSKEMFRDSMAVPLHFGNFDGANLIEEKPKLLGRKVEGSRSANLANDSLYEEALLTSNRESNYKYGGYRFNDETRQRDENLTGEFDFTDRSGYSNQIRREREVYLMRYRESLSSSSSTLSKRSRNREYSRNMDNKRASMPNSEKLDAVKAGNQPSVDVYDQVPDQVTDSSLQTPLTSDDEDFGYHLERGCHLLKQARERLIVQTDEELSENLLCESTASLSRAVSKKPESVTAVGQLGNAYLLHGELKLKISRDLRKLMSNEMENSETHSLSLDKVENVLVEVSEECEQLFIEAGRKYRIALALDGNDVRALYNWGLALSFRGQLLSDIGTEAAFDADKVFLAAIDKFDALISKSKTYAPEALYRWGITLQQRSRLRPRNSKDKMKLLQQAKSLFEDALYMNTGNKQVKEALSSCISELNYS